MGQVTAPIKTVCAWCGITIADGPAPIVNGHPRVSHGICHACAEKWMPKEKA